MDKAIKYGGWVLLVIVLIVGGYMLKTQTSHHRARAIAAAQIKVQELEKIRAEKSALEAEIAALKAAQVPAVPPSEPAPVAAQLPSSPEAPAPLEAPSTAPAPLAAETPDDSDRGERIANAQLGMVAEMMYKGLFDDLTLEPQVRAALKDIIAVHMQTMQQETMTAMGAKNETAKAFHARLEAMKADLRGELANSLTPEQLTAWDEYEPVADQALYERMVDGQLNMLAPGLSNENRVLASQVMSEELVRELDAFSQSDEIYNMDNHNGAQARALNASLERLSMELDEEQYGHVQSFVNQAIAMFDAMKEQ